MEKANNDVFINATITEDNINSICSSGIVDAIKNPELPNQSIVLVPKEKQQEEYKVIIIFEGSKDQITISLKNKKIYTTETTTFIPIPYNNK